MKEHCNTTLAALPIVALAAGYVCLVVLQQKRHRPWSRWRTTFFLSGCAIWMLGVLPRLLPFAQGDIRRHMVQHILVAMLGPTALVMGAPVTLVLRTLPSRYGRWITAVLHSRPLAVLSMPAVAMFLDFGGMAAIYFTPLYKAMMAYPSIHCLIMLHFAAAGYLYAWVIAGPDPAPRRPPVPVRLIALGVAVVIHSVISQMLYASWHVGVDAPAAQLQQAAELMYYGGDISEMLLAFALVTNWQPAARLASTH